MDIVNIIRKCDSWSPAEDRGAGSKYGRYYVEVCFDEEEDAKAFAVEMLMITSGQTPYDEIPDTESAS